MVCGEHGERVRPDLVRGVAVRRDAVGAGDDQVDLPPRHQRGRGGVGDHRVRDADRLELPRGEARPLEQRSRLIDEHACEQATFPGGAQRADRGAVAASGEPAGVAVRERPRPRDEELGGVRGHAAAALDLLSVQRAGALGRRVGAHLLERPEEVDRRGPRGCEVPLGGREIVAAQRGEREPVGGRDADRRRTPNSKRPNRLGDLGRRGADEVDLLVRQPPLVEDDDARRVVLQADDRVGV